MQLHETHLRDHREMAALSTAGQIATYAKPRGYRPSASDDALRPKRINSRRALALQSQPRCCRPPPRVRIRGD